MWATIINQPIQAQFTIDHNEVSEAINYSGTRHQKILDYLKDDSNIIIVDEGIMDAGDFAYTRHQFNQLDSEVPIIVNQFGPITVWLNVGFPDTVNNLVNSIKIFKSKLFKYFK